MARMAAGTRKRPDGTLEKRFTIEGKRYSVYGKSTKEITEKEQQIRQAVLENAHVTNMNITLNRYYAEWIERKRQTVKESTLCTYRTMITRRILPALGRRKIREIGRRDVIALQSALSEEMTAGSCNYTINVLGIILADAVRDDIIVKNPAWSIPAIKSDSVKATETIHRALTIEEQAAFMQEMRNDYYYTFVAMMLSTGMRYGEVAALQWSDIDKKSNVIHVRRTVTRTEHNKAAIGSTPKTSAGMRDIPITANVSEILREQHKYMNLFPTMAIFTNQSGGVVSVASLNRAIDIALDRLDKNGTHIEHFSSHALRDTFATRYIEGGGSMQTLKTILGHSSLAMTADLYAHVLPNTKQAEMDSIHIAI